MEVTGYLPRCVLLCSGGAVNILYAFGLGYGANMAVTGGARLTALTSGAGLMVDLTTDHRAAAATLYLAYGARLFWFLARRQVWHHFRDGPGVVSVRDLLISRRRAEQSSFAAAAAAAPADR